MEDLEEHFKKLKKYISQSLEKGHEPEHIRKTLLDHGWPEHHISKFLKKRDKEEYVKFEEESKERKVKATNSSIHETEFDKLYNLVQEKGAVNIQQVMQLFKIEKKLAEKWAEILKKAGLVDISYPAMGGDIEIRKKK